ncbi:sensor domain-containing diguanylate cyclase [Qipengyuania spongiae]|uniref:diguanylate cyclase n=1 Tax=Qipengyuania spongiae TaxID=2909673 RepID=A0ABY5T306_9SPHN|nr:sensor domain-containing diguanylate cyclase [Qipengyuania spongiae]UVI39924.1 diguanylate cyclase [Qipengyuania spongiae]
MGIAIGYFLLASATIATTRFGNGVAFIWIANAWLLAELSITTRRDWAFPIMACALASTVATTLFGFGLHYALPLAFINMSEAIVGALILRFLKPSATKFDSLDAMFAFILAAGIAAPALTAFGGAFVAELTGKPFWPNWLRWFAGHGLGALAFTPLFALLLRGDVAYWRQNASRSRVIEAVAALCSVLAVTFLVFSQDRLPLLFLPFLPMIIATFRLGRFGAALSVTILTLVGSYYTLLDAGPIALMGDDLGGRLQFLQFYLAITVLTVLPVAADLARRKQVHEALRDSEARYRLLTAKSSDIVMNLDADGCIRFVSPSVRALGGYEPEELMGTNAMDLVHADDREAVRQAHLDALRSPETPFIVDYRASRSDGAETWMETHTQGVRDEDGRVSGVVSVIRDVSHRKAREEMLAIEAQTDPLTGLLNRRGFARCVEKNAATSDTCRLAVFDIDRFKQVNDTYGHAAGDEVLRTFARVARAAVRENDKVGRLGGEEFAVLLTDSTLEQAMMICERLRQSMEREVTTVKGQSIRVTVSGGIARIVDGEDIQSTLSAADMALYEAKRAGRNQLALAA